MVSVLQGKEIILHYIKELISQGVTHIPPFESSKGRPRLLSTVEKQSSIERPDLEETIESEAEDQPEEPTFQPAVTEIHPETIQEAVEPPPLQGKLQALSLFLETLLPILCRWFFKILVNS